MRKFDVRGMSCAACSARVEKAVSSMEGITECSVNLLTNTMTVEGEATDEEIVAAVEKAGYGASPAGAREKSDPSKDEGTDGETKKILLRLVVSAVLLLALMYISMGHNMLSFPVGSYFDGDHASLGVLQLVLSALIMVINQRFFINGFKGLVHLAPNMDTLVSLGSATSFVYSVIVLFEEIKAQTAGDMTGVMRLHHDLYFESAAMILVLITVGKLLESYSKGRTTDALKGLMALAPSEATVIRDGREQVIDADKLRVGDVFLVRPGDKIPADGVVLEGSSAVDESALTGESIYADKSAGDSVSTATLNVSGFLRCEAQKVGEDTTLSRIVQMVSDVGAQKAPIARLADKVSAVFVPAVMSVALITTVIWLIVGREIGFALARGISVLVISCPCSLGLATPVAIMVGNGVGAKHGILFKTAAALEQAGRIEEVVLDKTGTITEGKPRLTDLFPAENVTEDELLSVAASIEYQSEHPISKAVISYADQRSVASFAVKDFKTVPGRGLSALCDDGETIFAGNRDLVSENATISEEHIKYFEENSNKGKTAIFISKGGRYLGMLCVADVVREDSAEAIAELKKIGVNSVMLTGDNQSTAEAIASSVGIDEVIAGVYPDRKANEVARIKEYKKTAMVGDGINDAPALKTADLGIAIGAGTDIAIDAADVVLVNSSLGDVFSALKLGRATLKNIKENLFWAFFYNVIGIPIAAGVLIAPFDIKLSPMIGAAAMSLSSVCVVLNALRLNTVKLKKRSVANREEIHENRKEVNMDNVIKMKIEGMMCQHCEARVKSAIEALDFVESAVVSHADGSAEVRCKDGADKEKLKSAVENAGYKVLGVD